MDTSDVELPQPRPEHRQVEAGQASVVRTVEWVRGGRAQHVVEIHLSHQTCAGKTLGYINLLETCEPSNSIEGVSRGPLTCSQKRIYLF